MVHTTSTLTSHGAKRVSIKEVVQSIGGSDSGKYKEGYVSKPFTNPFGNTSVSSNDQTKYKICFDKHTWKKSFCIKTFVKTKQMILLKQKVK